MEACSDPGATHPFAPIGITFHELRPGIEDAWAYILSCTSHDPDPETRAMTTIPLPEPALTGDVSIEEALHQRRLIREFAAVPLSLGEISQLGWAAQGITDPVQGLRATPSAGATFPIDLYFLLTGLEDVPDGVYRYRPDDHTLEQIREGDLRRDLQSVPLGVGTVVIGAFDDGGVSRVLMLDEGEYPLYIMPLGRMP